MLDGGSEFSGIRALAANVRSKLFVPGSRPELFAKAEAGAADALSFDLEDSVVASRKVEARSEIAAYLNQSSASSKVMIVRVNALGSGLFHEDIAKVTVPGLHIINVPKVESADDVQRAADAIAGAERAAGMNPCVGILANIETPRGLRNAWEIASAHPQVCGLQIGFLDLSMACGIDADSSIALNAVRIAVRLASAEAGMAAFDGAYGAVKDADGFRAQAAAARALGLAGKSCIHPSQVLLANEVFTPSHEAVAEAVRIVRAAQQAAADGAGAVQMDGKMIDAPVVERARRLLARARHHGLPTNEDGE